MDCLLEAWTGGGMQLISSVVVSPPGKYNPKPRSHGGKSKQVHGAARSCREQECKATWCDTDWHQPWDTVWDLVGWSDLQRKGRH